MTTADDDHDLLGQSHVNIIPDAEPSVVNNKPASPDHRVLAPANASKTPIDSKTDLPSPAIIFLSPSLAFVERVHQVILRLFELKRSEKVKIDCAQRLFTVSMIDRHSF